MEISLKTYKQLYKAFLEVNIRRTVRKQDQEALDGIIHLLDALQDEHENTKDHAKKR